MKRKTGMAIVLGLAALSCALLLLAEIAPGRKQAGRKQEGRSWGLRQGDHGPEVGRRPERTGDVAAVRVLRPRHAGRGGTPADVEKDLRFLKPYHVLVVQCGQDEEDGTTKYQSQADVCAAPR